MTDLVTEWSCDDDQREEHEVQEMLKIEIIRKLKSWISSMMVAERTLRRYSTFAQQKVVAQVDKLEAWVSGLY